MEAKDNSRNNEGKASEREKSELLNFTRYASIIAYLELLFVYFQKTSNLTPATLVMASSRSKTFQGRLQSENQEFFSKKYVNQGRPSQY